MLSKYTATPSAIGVQLPRWDYECVRLETFPCSLELQSGQLPGVTAPLHVMECVKMQSVEFGISIRRLERERLLEFFEELE